MDILIGPPPRKSIARRGKYKSLMDSIRESNGTWVSIPAGKQNSIHAAARVRGMRVKTTIQDGRLYVRRIDTEAKIDDGNQEHVDVAMDHKVGLIHA
jgi:hypothetical protein